MCAQKTTSEHQVSHSLSILLCISFKGPYLTKKKISYDDFNLDFVHNFFLFFNETQPECSYKIVLIKMCIRQMIHFARYSSVHITGQTFCSLK